MRTFGVQREVPWTSAGRRRTSRDDPTHLGGTSTGRPTDVLVLCGIIISIRSFKYPRKLESIA